MLSICDQLAKELQVKTSQVEAAIRLLDEGATVPFIARYRKEATDGLDDTVLRNLDERLGYLRELNDRREVILKSIAEQQKLTPELQADILAADTKTRLEDLYRPYKPKRRTKGQIAIEAGLEPLAQALYDDPSQDPSVLAQTYLNAELGVNTIKEALEGAKYILMERFADLADLVGKLREYCWENGLLKSQLVAGKAEEGAKFADYFDRQESIKSIPSHRMLALLRARQEGVLTLQLILPAENTEASLSIGERMVAVHVDISDKKRAADGWLLEVVRWTWQVKLLMHIEAELITQAKELAETEAIKVFGMNLRDLLLAAPAGLRATMGLDPGIRTGVKVAIVDATGKLLDTATIYPHAPKNQWDESIAILAILCKKHHVDLISIGNGTASRETDKLAGDLMKQHPSLHLTKAIVSEAGASVYSASAFAAKEFPELDVSLRGAVSIARRLQDPLAELVKIEPKAIGVGQYQHDVSQTQLARTLDAVVEDCVNNVGVDINSASVPLLARISGLNQSLAENIVALRNEKGRFTSREELKKVKRLGDKAFEQSAGFLRIFEGVNPLDASAVHPEAYPVINHVLTKNNKQLKEIIGNSQFLASLRPQDYATEQFGLPTVLDIIRELEKPGRDPRPDFKTAVFKEGVEDIKQLAVGMILEGVVTNVTNFGAFVDIGVHQDGLVHISQLSNRFVTNAHEVVKAGDIVQVKVVEVDVNRKRIALTMKLAEKIEAVAVSDKKPVGGFSAGKIAQKQQMPVVESAMALAFKKAQEQQRK